jgi:peptidyl-prolyl cis-trans isomerase SurA
MRTLRIRSGIPGFARTLAVAISLLAASAALSGAGAQDVQRIAAVVNEEVISVFDVQQRVRLLIVSSGLPNTPETVQRIAPQVLRGLIDEALQNQEARRLNISVSTGEIDDAIGRIERANGLPSGGFEGLLDQQQISREAAIEQIRSNILWQKLLSRTVIPQIEIGEEDIDSVVARIAASQGVTELRIAEILLPVDNPVDAPDIRALGLRLVEQIRSGADFSSVARQFSKSATAAAGGEIGWIRLGELGPAVDGVLKEIAPGQVSDPVVVPEGVQIVFLIEQRTNEPPDPGERNVTLRQMLLAVPDGAPQAEVDAQQQTARTIASTVRGCADFTKAAEEAGTPQPAQSASFKLNDLNQQLRQVAASLPIGQASAPIRNADGFQVLMICDRQEELGPDREEIRRTLRRERADMLSRRYLRDLRRTAFVDLRV